MSVTNLITTINDIRTNTIGALDKKYGDVIDEINRYRKELEEIIDAKEAMLNKNVSSLQNNGSRYIQNTQSIITDQQDFINSTYNNSIEQIQNTKQRSIQYYENRKLLLENKIKKKIEMLDEWYNQQKQLIIDKITDKTAELLKTQVEILAAAAGIAPV